MRVIDPQEMERKVNRILSALPTEDRTYVSRLWSEWRASEPVVPLYMSWLNFALARGNDESLFDRRTISIRRIANEIRDMEVPKSTRQRIVAALSALATAFFLVIMALSRLVRASE
ncbi:MAG: hypothetical protein QXS20_11035 [Candidatus Thorarchaeota archaeon]